MTRAQRRYRVALVVMFGSLAFALGFALMVARPWEHHTDPHPWKLCPSPRTVQELGKCR